jgi:hypothetical protein
MLVTELVKKKGPLLPEEERYLSANAKELFDVRFQNLIVTMNKVKYCLEVSGQGRPPLVVAGP